MSYNTVYISQASSGARVKKGPGEPREDQGGTGNLPSGGVGWGKKFSRGPYPWLDPAPPSVP